MLPGALGRAGSEVPQAGLWEWGLLLEEHTLSSRPVKLNRELLAAGWARGWLLRRQLLPLHALPAAPVPQGFLELVHP